MTREAYILQKRNKNVIIIKNSVFLIIKVITITSFKIKEKYKLKSFYISIRFVKLSQTFYIKYH